MHGCGHTAGGEPRFCKRRMRNRTRMLTRELAQVRISLLLLVGRSSDPKLFAAFRLRVGIPSNNPCLNSKISRYLGFRLREPFFERYSSTRSSLCLIVESIYFEPLMTPGVERQPHMYCFLRLMVGCGYRSYGQFRCQISARNPWFSGCFGVQKRS